MSSNSYPTGSVNHPVEALRRSEFVVVRTGGDTVQDPVARVIAPKHLQVGLEHPDFRSTFRVIGSATFDRGSIIHQGITGSLQKLPDGTDYLRAGTNIAVTNNADGSVTIGTSGGAFTGTTTNPLGFGDGLAGFSTSTGAAVSSFTGAASTLLKVKQDTSAGTFTGLNISPAGVRVRIDNMTAVTPHADDMIMISDDSDSNKLKKVTVSSLGLTVAGNVNLNNPITPGAGLVFDSGNVSYNNAAAETIKINLASNSGLEIDGDALRVKPDTAQSKPLPVGGDTVIISDSAAGGVPKKATLTSLGIAANTLSNALTIGDGLENASGQSGVAYNNSAAQTIRVKTNGSTISSNASGISVASTPGTLSAGSGINAFSFDGSSNATISVDTSNLVTYAADGTFTGDITFTGAAYGKFKIDASTPLIKAGNNVSITTAASGQMTINSNAAAINIGSYNQQTPVRTDIMVLESGGSTIKSSVASIADLVDRTTIAASSDTIQINNAGAANAFSAAVKLSGGTISASSSGLSVASVPNSITQGTGISAFSFDGSGAATVAIDESVVPKLNGSTFTGVVNFNAGISGSIYNLTDGKAYITGGTGILVTTASNGQVVITNTGGGGGASSMNIHPLVIDENGGHLNDYMAIADESDGNATKKITLQQLKTLIGAGGATETFKTISVSGQSDVVADSVTDSLTLVGGSNVTITTDAASDTITFSSSGGNFTAGDGLDLSDTEFSLDLKSAGGLKITSGEIEVEPSDFAGHGLEDDGSDNLRISTAAAGTGLTGGGGAALAVDYSGDDSVIKSATDGTGITIDPANDLLLLYDNSDTTVKYVKANQIGVIGAAEDTDYTDGLFTDFTDTTRVGVTIDRFNEVLKLLVPAPAPDLFDIDYNNQFQARQSVVPAKLSFGETNDQSSATPAYATVANTAGIGAAVDINQDYNVAENSNNLRAAVFNGSIDIIGDLNEAVPADITSPSNRTNYVANSFADADVGSLVLELNGADIYTLDLTSETTGAGQPGSGSGNHVHGGGHDYEGSGFINVSLAKSGTFDNGNSFDSFKHRTGQWKVAATGNIGQRNGWNYVRIKHIKGSVTKVTNYVEWVNDSDNNNLSVGGNSLIFTGTGSLYISGINYNTGGNCRYQVTVSNAYRYVYDSNDVTFTTSGSGLRSGVSYSISNIAKPAIGVGENHLKQIVVNELDAVTANYILGGSLTAGINVTHPLKSPLNNSGQSSVTGLLIYNVAEDSTVTTENFQREAYRLQANDYSNQTDITGGSLNWDSSQSLIGSSNGHNTGLQVYRERLYAPKNTLNSGDFRNSNDGGSLANGPDGNPNYTSATGERVYYRKFQNTGAAKRDLSYVISGDATLVGHGDSIGANKNFKLYFKMPSDNSGNATGWLDAKSSFTYNNISDNSGCAIGAVDTSVPISSPSNNITFGTVEVGTNEWIVARIIADEDWTGYLDSIAVTFGAVNAVDAAPNVNNIDQDTNGVQAKLSFGDTLGKDLYFNVETTAGGTEKNANDLYEMSAPRHGVLNKSSNVVGTINETTNASSNSYPANAFGGGIANQGKLLLFVNTTSTVEGDATHVVDLSTFSSGNSFTNNSGFNLSAATVGLDNNSLPDYTKFYRTGTWQVATADQRNGFNFVRVIHRVGGSDHTSSYVEWVNDDSNQNITFSGVAIGNFSSNSTYQCSGITYFINPTGRFDYTASNVYKYVYSPNADAISYPTTTNCTISAIEITGDGVSNGSVNAASRALPDLTTSVSDAYDDDILVKATFSFTQTSIPGETERTVTLKSRVHHPLMSQAGNIETNSITSAVILAANFTDNSTNTLESFNGESKRMKAGNTSYTTQAHVTGGSNNWNSATNMESGDAAHNTGLAVYDGKLRSPQKIGLNSDLGDFRNLSQGGSIISPDGNPDYSSLTNATREYIRWFRNTTGGSKTDFNITIQGTGTVVSNSASLTNSNKFRVFAKIPNANADQTTGWMDTSLPFETGQNGDNAGALVGSLSSSLNTTYRVTFGTKFVQNNEYILIKIVADKTWTGNLTQISISWI